MVEYCSKEQFFTPNKTTDQRIFAMDPGTCGFRLESISHVMFRPSSGNVMIKMADEVTRVYSTLLPRVVRNPRSRFTKESRPLLLAVPDLPVSKHQKQKPQHEKINNGLHMHGILVVPCKSRLKTDIVTHFNQLENTYVKNGFASLV